MLQQELFEREAARFPAFENNVDIFCDDEENKAEQPSTSTAPSFPSLLTAPRASFSFPDITLDSNGGTPRLHLAGTIQSPQHAQQEAATDSATNGASGSSTFGGEKVNGHAENGTSDLPLSAGPSSDNIQAEVDYQSWPVKELRRFLSERGVVSMIYTGALDSCYRLCWQPECVLLHNATNCVGLGWPSGEMLHSIGAVSGAVILSEGC